MAETQTLPRLGSRKTSPQEHVPIPSTRDAEPKGCLSGEASMGSLWSRKLNVCTWIQKSEYRKITAKHESFRE